MRKEHRSELKLVLMNQLFCEEGHVCLFEEGIVGSDEETGCILWFVWTPELGLVDIGLHWHSMCAVSLAHFDSGGCHAYGYGAGHGGSCAAPCAVKEGVHFECYLSDAAVPLPYCCVHAVSALRCPPSRQSRPFDGAARRVACPAHFWLHLSLGGTDPPCRKYSPHSCVNCTRCATTFVLVSFKTQSALSSELQDDSSGLRRSHLTYRNRLQFCNNSDLTLSIYLPCTGKTSILRCTELVEIITC